MPSKKSLQIKLQLKKSFRKSARFPYATILKVVVASLAGGAVAYGVRVSFSETLPLITFAEVLLQGVLAGFAGFATYFLTMFLLRSEEIYSVIHSLQRRFFRRKVLPPHWDGGDLPH